MLIKGKIEEKNCLGRKRLEYIDSKVKDERCGHMEIKTLGQHKA